MNVHDMNPPQTDVSVADYECDFQSFMKSYDVVNRIVRLLRLAYLVGVADGQSAYEDVHGRSDAG